MWKLYTTHWSNRFHFVNSSFWWQFLPGIDTRRIKRNNWNNIIRFIQINRVDSEVLNIISAVWWSKCISFSFFDRIFWFRSEKKTLKYLRKSKRYTALTSKMNIFDLNCSVSFGRHTVIGCHLKMTWIGHKINWRFLHW